MLGMGVNESRQKNTNNIREENIGRYSAPTKITLKTINMNEGLTQMCKTKNVQ